MHAKNWFWFRQDALAQKLQMIRITSLNHPIKKDGLQVVNGNNEFYASRNPEAGP